MTLGLTASFALSRTVESALFGVSPVDSLTYALAPTLLLIVVIAVSSVPAWRATRVPMIEALRTD